MNLVTLKQMAFEQLIESLEPHQRAVLNMLFEDIFGVPADRVRYARLSDKPKMTTFYAPKITKVIFNKPATIVFWEDSDKTIVKCSENDIYDPEKGLAMEISKKFFGNTGRYFEEFKKWIPEEVETEETNTITDGLIRILREIEKYVPKEEETKADDDDDDEDFHYVIKNPDVVDESMTIKDIDKEILTLMLAEGRPNIDERIRKLKLRKEELKRLEEEAKHD